MLEIGYGHVLDHQTGDDWIGRDVGPVLQSDVGVQRRLALVGTGENRILQDDFRWAGLDLNSRAAPLTASYLQILGTELTCQYWFLQSAVHGRLHGGRPGDLDRSRLATYRRDQRCELMQIIGCGFDLQVRMTAELSLRGNGCRWNAD